MSAQNKPGALVVKDPHSTNDPWGMDWSTYLAELGASARIASSSWTVTGPDALLVVASAEVVAGSRVTQVYLNGGTVGKRYTLTNRIVTNTVPAVTDDRSFRVLIQNQ